jgi:hypothetical protein
MRFFNALLSIVPAACVAVFLSGCAKAPDQELAAAKTAFKVAQDAEAEKYLPNNFSNLQKAMEGAEAEVELQKSKFALSQNFKRAQLLLKNVTELATQITADVPGAKEAMKVEVEKGLASTQRMVKETRGEVKKIARSKDKKILAQMMADLDKADAASVQAAADFAAGNIVDAVKKITEAQGSLKNVSDKLSCNGVDGLM